VSGAGGTISSVTGLHVVTYGAEGGRAVLALHGVTAHAARWRVLAEALPELRFVAVDLRGHGHSPWFPPWHLEQHVADALAVLDGLGLSRVVVFGHSFGGAVAVHLARAAPERVERLVLLDPAIGLDPQDMLDTAEETRADESYPDREAARADRAVRWPWAPAELVEAELAENLLQDGDRWRYRYSRASVVAAWSEMARPAVTPPASLPTLLLPAAQADYVDPAWVRACQAELGERLTVCEIDAAHILHLERTAEVTAQVRAFLGQEGADG
jgi:lipase